MESMTAFKHVEELIAESRKRHAEWCRENGIRREDAMMSWVYGCLIEARCVEGVYGESSAPEILQKIKQDLGITGAWDD
jgi:hypothetical protein